MRWDELIIPVYSGVSWQYDNILQRMHFKEHYRENETPAGVLYGIISEITFLNTVKMFIPMMQSHKHRLSPVNSS